MAVGARIRFRSRAAKQTYRAMRNLVMVPVTTAQAREFANTLRPVTRVDTGSLQRSVGHVGNIAGYGINFYQRPPKQFAPHNVERFRLAQRLSRPGIRIQTVRVWQSLLRRITRRFGGR